MKDMLFDTKEKRDFAVASFNNLLGNPGWQLLTQILEANIEIVEKQILEGVDEETKETIDRLRDKLKVYKEVRDTPVYVIDRLTGAKEGSDITLDPFQTVEQLQEEKEKLTKTK